MWRSAILIFYELSQSIWQYVLIVLFARLVLNFIDLLSLGKKTVKCTVVIIRDEIACKTI